MTGVQTCALPIFRTLRGEPLLRLAATERVWFELATLEGVGGLANLLAQIPATQILSGSHAPFFYFEAAALKLKESALTAAQLTAIRSGNAERLLPR